MDPSRTHHANQALHTADLINLKFSPERFGTENPRYVKVREPDGPSTDGGRKARQAILLCAASDEEGGGIVCGFVDVTKKIAELRSYVVLKQAFETRFHQELDLSRGEHGRFLEKMREFLGVQGFEVRVSNAPRSPSVIAQPTLPPTTVDIKRSLPAWMGWVASGTIGFVICYLLFRLGVLN
jgi:hypothetical protein